MNNALDPTAHSAPAAPGVVYLCGAGPGDPSLLTLRAAHLLATAEVILPDDLVSPHILALANPLAEVIPVGKRCGQPRITQGGIHTLMIEHARPDIAGLNRPRRSVLRLKSGDPLVFGRAGEEIDALTEAGIGFEIVPGITAALAIAAALQTPLTDRAAASRLVFATAHHSSGEPRLPALHPGETIALYMPGRNFEHLSASLLASGIAPDTPALIVSRGATPEQHSTYTTVGKLPDSIPHPAPLLLLIGDAIRNSTKKLRKT